MLKSVLHTVCHFQMIKSGPRGCAQTKLMGFCAKQTTKTHARYKNYQIQMFSRVLMAVQMVLVSINAQLSKEVIYALVSKDISQIVRTRGSAKYTVQRRFALYHVSRVMYAPVQKAI